MNNILVQDYKVWEIFGKIFKLWGFKDLKFKVLKSHDLYIFSNVFIF